MKIAHVLLQDYDSIISNARRVIERIPSDKAEWRPDPKSMAMGRLAMHCATLPSFGVWIVTDDGMDGAAPKEPWPSFKFDSAEAATQQLDTIAAKCRAAIADSSDEQFLTPWPFKYGEKVISNTSRLLSLRGMCLNHIIHHTAQLGVYLRLNSIAVPGIYGPSADEAFVP